MKFSRLRLSGFKSFVEPTELHIEPGLTGVVGPNGCGKSNLLEALRWVMGESSYKSMRASGMDDVIFSGTASRPARNMAEVVVTMDNADRSGPPSCSESDTVEISRRIEREAGSAYRVNGKDVRARDVQLLFADASTGARSPSLVRQGQIGEIINSKPQARRRILEEAAGITGLHTRRHEAELKLNAAETNLTRLEDVVGQLESQLQSLKRQARQAVRYKQLSGDIRRLEAAGLYSAWRDAAELLAAEKQQLDEVTRLLGGFTKAVSEFTRVHDDVTEGLPKLREHEATRSAVLQRLTLEREGLEREEAQASGRREELHARLEQIQADTKREQDILGDTDEAAARLDAEEEALKSAGDDADQRAAAAKALQAAADKLAKSQEEADEANAALSALAAKRNALTGAISEQSQKLARLEQEIAGVNQQRQAIADETGGSGDAGELSQSVDAAVQAASAAESAVHGAEASVRDLRQSETTARQAFDEARRKSDNIATEVRTLTKLLKVADSDLWPPLVDAVKVNNGYEVALGAALGDEIDAPADEAAPVHWKALPPIAEAPGLPEGAEPLTRFVKAPPALARRLAHIGVVSRKDGARLQPLLKSGQRLVSVEGDLWRWDGYSATADAPTAAAQRLAERNRLGELQSESTAVQRATDEARQQLDQIKANLETAVKAEKDTRDAWRTTTAGVEAARQNLSSHERELSEKLQQASALKEAARRLESSLDEASGARTAAETELQELPPADGLEERLAAARQVVEEDRTSYSEARATFDGLEREARLKAGRLEAIGGERQQWRDRSERAKGQIEALDTRTGSVRSELEGLSDLPQQFEEKRKKLMNLLGEA
ncbi:MAG: AAA family ATPase, partial [Aestuariivirgaceae bacterium]